MSEDEDDEKDETSTVPLQDLRPFYRSRARQELTFVRAGSTPDSSVTASHGSRAAEAYAAIVLKDQPEPISSASSASNANSASADASVDNDASAICEICKFPLDGDTTMTTTTLHAASLAHQVCLAHSHPPSHLDREHVGLRYMTARGWDPDARVGLGAEGNTGIRAPIKAVKKNDTAGLGLVFPPAKNGVKREPAKREMLDAGKVRKLHAEGRRKDAKLREMFYGDDKIAKYLGGGDEGGIG